MSSSDLLKQAVSAWRVNNTTNLLLLEGISKAGWLYEPAGPRARNIAQVCGHLHNTRIAWVKWHDPASVIGMKRFEPRTVPSRTEVKKALNSSRKMVETFLIQAVHGKTKVRSFKKHPLRFLIYLIMHEAHHRGQIAYALKRADMKLPMAVTGKFWANWIWGKE